MNFNNFTIKSQEAVQEAVNLVQSRGQQAIEPVHMREESVRPLIWLTLRKPLIMEQILPVGRMMPEK